MTSKLNETYLNFSTHHYDGFYEWDEMKIFYVCFQIIITFISPALLYAIIWYENNHSSSYYRTAINIILSHVCWISLVRSTFTRIPFVFMVLYGPLPNYACNVIILSAHYLFQCIIYEIMLWQLMKYVHVFYWSIVANINDAFLAQFATTVNFLTNFVLLFIKFILGFYYTDINYHICTGKHPSIDILSHSYLVKNIDQSKNILVGLAKLELYTNYHFYAVIMIMMYTSVKIWIYDKKNMTENICANGQNHSTVTQKYLQKTKNTIIESRGSLAAVSIIAILLIPSFVLRFYSYTESDNIN